MTRFALTITDFTSFQIFHSDTIALYFCSSFLLTFSAGLECTLVVQNLACNLFRIHTVVIMFLVTSQQMSTPIPHHPKNQESRFQFYSSPTPSSHPSLQSRPIPFPQNLNSRRPQLAVNVTSTSYAQFRCRIVYPTFSQATTFYHLNTPRSKPISGFEHRRKKVSYIGAGLKSVMRITER